MTETIQVGPMTLRFLQDKDGTGGSLDMFEMTVPPGARMPVPHYHENWDETAYGIAGTMGFTIDGRDVAIGPGDSLFIPRGAVHGFYNRSDAPATMLAVLSPGVLGPAYFRAVGALAAQGEPDPAAMAALMKQYGLVPVA